MAKNSMTFDEAINNTATLFKTSLTPVIEAINKTLLPLVEKFFANKDFTGKMVEFGDKIGGFVSSIGSFLSGAMNLATTLGPGGTLAAIIGAKGLMSAIQWFTNGTNLAAGFNAASAKSGGGGLDSGSSGKSGLGKWGKAAGGAAGGAMMGAGAAVGADSMAEGAGNVIGGMIGGAALSFIPVVGTMLGGFLGSKLGGMIGKSIGGDSSSTPSIGDGIISSPIHDGHIGSGLGSDYSKGRGIVQGGKITPIDNKDDLIAAKPRGVIDNAMGNGVENSTRVSFDEIKFAGNITLSMAGTGGSTDITKYLLNNPEFLRDITRMVHVETSKAINGGKISGQPHN